MKNIGIIIVLILIAGAGWWLYSSGEEAGTAPEQGAAMTGDTGAPAGADTAAVPSDSIVGTWKSVDDAKFTRTIYENGQYKDTYEGQPSADMSGPWVTFTAENAPSDFPYPTEAGATYLKLDSGSNALYFKISNVTSTDLELIYLDRGGALRFTRA